MRRPLLRKAICWKRVRSTSYSNSTDSVKISGSGQKVMSVPVASVGSPFSSFCCGTPPSAKLWCQAKPFCLTVTSKRVDSAFTTDEPTPCRPPETA